MKEILILTLIILASGCAGYKIMIGHGDVDGNNLITPYGPASGHVVYDGITCIEVFGGKCPITNTLEVLSAKYSHK